MKDVNQTVSERIQRLLVGSITLPELAKCVEIPQDRLQDLIDCTGEEIQYEEFTKFRKNLFISPDYLVGFQDNAFIFDDDEIPMVLDAVMERMKELSI